MSVLPCTLGLGLAFGLASGPASVPTASPETRPLYRLSDEAPIDLGRMSWQAHRPLFSMSPDDRWSELSVALSDRVLFEIVLDNAEPSTPLSTRLSTRTAAFRRPLFDMTQDRGPPTSSLSWRVLFEPDEDAMFGGDTATTAVDSRPLFSPNEEAMFGTDTGTTSAVEQAPESPEAGLRLAERLGVADDTLQIGGIVWLRLQYNALSEGSFSDFSLVSPNLLDLYLDARPEDRVRFFAQGRLNFDPTVEEGAVSVFGTPQQRTFVQLDQLWLKFDILRTVYLTVGKQRIRWGSSRLWNPTDFLNLQRLNPLAFFDQRLGVTLVKVHVPVETLGWNFYALANLEGATSPSELGAAFRAEVVVGPAEIAASFAVRENNPDRYGFDISAGVWELDVRAELALLRGVSTPFFREPGDGVRDVVFSSPRDVERGGAIFREDDVIPQLVLGADWAVRYGDDDIVIVGFEYFFNDAGHPDESFYPELFIAGAFTPLYVGRHYLGASVILAAPGAWDEASFTLSAIANLSDASAIARLDFGLAVLRYLSLRAFLSGHAGSGELRLGIEAPIRIVPPLFEVGSALVLDF